MLDVHTSVIRAEGGDSSVPSCVLGVLPVPPVSQCPQKKKVVSPIFCTNVRLEALLLPTGVFFLYDIPSFCHNFSHTFDPKMHHPAMDS